MTHPVNSNSFIVKNRHYPHKSPPRGKRWDANDRPKSLRDGCSYIKCREKERNNKHYIFI